MRVLIYAPAARMGGAHAHVLGVTPELAQLAPSDDFLLLAQPTVLSELARVTPHWIRRSDGAQHRSFLRRLLWEQRVLPRIAEAWRADVLLSFGSFVPLRAPCVTVLEAANALPFTPLYWRVLEREPIRLRLQERARWSLLKASLRAAERVLVPTRAMRQDVVTRLPPLISRIDVAPWGVATRFLRERWRPPTGDCQVLGVSNHGINKEFDILVRALALLADRLPDLRLLMTGRADESRYARRTASIARRLGVEARARFVDDIPNRHMPDLIAQARVMVYPTWCESFGLPLAEALAMGAPAIAADIPACREVGGDAALYYSAGDHASLAESIETLVRSPEMALDLADRGPARGKQFTWRANAELVLESLRKAVR